MMTRADSTHPHDDWSLIAAAVEALNVAWESGPGIPDLRSFFHPEKVEDSGQLLTELIKADLEHRWNLGLRRFIEEYFDDFPELADAVPAELIFEEYHIRRLAEDDVSPEELISRFPHRRQQLVSLLAVNPSLAALGSGELRDQSWKDVESGQRLGDFDLLLELGAGSFAKVFFARQRSMQRLVAVKVSEDRGTEGITLAQLDHEYIVRVYDQQTVPERRVRLLYMQYVPGGTLADVIRELRRMPSTQWSGQVYQQIIASRIEARGEQCAVESSVRARLMQLTWPELVCWIGVRLASALQYAHRQQVLHRDLKPANILLTSEGLPKLADFNISFSGRTEGTTAQEQFGGSLAYMSPEQLRACDPSDARSADELDERSDLFSLGVLLWELLYGQRPFPDPDPAEAGFLPFQYLLQGRQTPVIASADTERASGETEAGLRAILLQCLAFRREDRPASASSVKLELDLCLDPEARRLLNPRQEPLRRLMCDHPVLTAMTLTLIPNIYGAVFNFNYNYREIQLHLPDAKQDFMKVQSVINAVAFPIGVIVGVRMILAVAAAVRSDDLDTVQAQQLMKQRQQCVHMGRQIGFLSLTLWMLAAPAYPVALHLMRGGLPLSLYGHFMASLALCGLIAAAYPFIGVSCLATRCFYPNLLRWDTVNADDITLLERLSQSAWMAILSAALIPMLGAGMMVLVDSGQRSSLLALTVGGAVGFGMAVAMFRMLQRDLAVLIRTLKVNRTGSA